MGYLTTVTIYNDGLSLLNRYPEEFCENLTNASGSHEEQDIGLGNHCNFAHAQRTRHADDHTMYVHMGNCVTEVNAYDPKFKALVERNPDFADALIAHVANELKALKRLQKARNEKRAEE